MPMQQQGGYLPDPAVPLLMEQFNGLNTSTTRAGVPDEQCYYIDGFIPLDAHNLRTLYDVGTTLYAAVGTTIVFFYFVNLSATPYAVVFLADGSVVAVNVNTSMVTTLLAAGTITNPTQLNIGISQWGQQYIIIVANQTNGYWVWDGTSVYTAGTIGPQVSITNGGQGYFAPPNISVGGVVHGGGVTFSVSINNGVVVSAIVTNPGIGFLPGDTPTLVFSGGLTSGTGAVITASIGAAGTVVSTSISNGGSNYGHPTGTLTFLIADPSPSVLVSAQFVVATPPGPITTVSILNSGAGYHTNATRTFAITDGTVTAAGSITLMPFGVSGNAVETYSGHVWVANKNLIQFSAPGSVSDFATSDGGGSQQSNSSYLKIGYTRLIQSNGFLFLIADSSIDYISGVQTSGVSPTTTYTLQNASPTIGTPYPWSILLRGQDLLMANSLGVYVVAGSQPTKISQMLDGFWGTVPNFGGLNLSSAHANIFSREVWMTLAKFIDPVTNATVTKPCMWDGGKRWFVSSQNMTMTYIASQEINSVFTTYGTDGTILAPLFSVPSTNFTKTVQSKLWGEPGGAMITKMPDRFWAIADYYSVTSPAITATIDAVQVEPVSGTVTNTSVTYTLAGPIAPLHYVTAPQAIGQQGVLIGMTIKTNCNDMALVSVLTDQKPAEYRG